MDRDGNPTVSFANKCLIVVHAGAGYHSIGKESEYKKTCARACRKAMVALKKGASAVEAVSTAIQSLEDAVCTNAGTGSSLTMSGTVECDASIMDGATLKFGAVGAVSGVKNPILVARKLVEEQMEGTLSLGRIPPCAMVGEGATQWARAHGIPTVLQHQLKTDVSIETYNNHKRRLEASEERRNAKRRKHLGQTEAYPPLVQDKQLHHTEVHDNIIQESHQHDCIAIKNTTDLLKCKETTSEKANGDKLKSKEHGNMDKPQYVYSETGKMLNVDGATEEDVFDSVQPFAPGPALPNVCIKITTDEMDSLFDGDRLVGVDNDKLKGVYASNQSRKVHKHVNPVNIADVSLGRDVGNEITGAIINKQAVSFGNVDRDNSAKEELNTVGIVSNRVEDVKDIGKNATDEALDTVGAASEGLEDVSAVLDQLQNSERTDIKRVEDVIDTGEDSVNSVESTVRFLNEGVDNVKDIDDVVDTVQDIAGTSSQEVDGRHIDEDTMDLIQDTVGAIAIDCQGNIAAGVSSGGVSLKQPGRLGPAAMYGAGCWANNWRDADRPGVAVATSGTGEHLIKTLLARTCGESVQRSDLATEAVNSTLTQQFLESEFLADTSHKYGGLIALRLDKTGTTCHCELLWGHTTASMSIGYMTSNARPQTLISRLDNTKGAGQSHLMEGRHLAL